MSFYILRNPASDIATAQGRKHLGGLMDVYEEYGHIGQKDSTVNYIKSMQIYKIYRINSPGLR